MKIIVMSCDKNEDTFKPFHWCLEEYYPNHPEVIYFTETIKNPYYKTISIPRDLSKWTKGVREFLKWVDDDVVLFMIDDIFIRQPVDEQRINEAAELVFYRPYLACCNFEKSWDANDTETIFEGWKKRPKGSEYEVSLMCGVWNKGILAQVLDRDCDPWTIELQQDSKGFDYYINSGEYIIDWGYKYGNPCNIVKGKWTRECIKFLTSKGFILDFEKRGIV